MCTAAPFLRCSGIVQRWSFHRVQHPVCRLHGSVHVNLSPSLVGYVPWCEILWKKSITFVSTTIFQCLVCLKRFSSLCCSYCLVPINPPTAPVMETFSRRVSHTANWLRAVTSPLLSPHSPLWSVQLCCEVSCFVARMKRVHWRERKRAWVHVCARAVGVLHCELLSLLLGFVSAVQIKSSFR